MWISFPNRGLNPVPLHWECKVLTTGPPGKSLLSSFLITPFCMEPPRTWLWWWPSWTMKTRTKGEPKSKLEGLWSPEECTNRSFHLWHSPTVTANFMGQLGWAVEPRYLVKCNSGYFCQGDFLGLFYFLFCFLEFCYYHFFLMRLTFKFIESE